MEIRIKTVLTVLTVLLIGKAIYVAGETPKNHEERDIFFNREHYDNERREAKEKLIDIAKKICPNRTREVEEKLEEFAICSENIDENEEMMCQVIEENLKTCVKPFFDLIESCVSKKSKGLPTYLLKNAEAVVKYLCNIDGAHLLELGNPCILRKNHPYSRKCIRKLRLEVAKYDFENLPEKQQLCLFLNDFEECFKAHLENSCLDVTTRETYLGLYKTFLCQK